MELRGTEAWTCREGDRMDKLRVITEGHTYDIVIEEADIYDNRRDCWEPSRVFGPRLLEQMAQFLEDSDAVYDGDLDGWRTDWATLYSLREEIVGHLIREANRQVNENGRQRMEYRARVNGGEELWAI